MKLPDVEVPTTFYHQTAVSGNTKLLSTSGKRQNPQKLPQASMQLIFYSIGGVQLGRIKTEMTFL